MQIVREGVPKSVVRNRGCDDERLVADGVCERDGTCVEADAAVGVGAFGSILEVALDGMPDVRELRADLVVTTRVEIDFEE